MLLRRTLCNDLSGGIPDLEGVYTSITTASVYLYSLASTLIQLPGAQLCRARLSAGGLVVHSTASDKMGKEVE